MVLLIARFIGALASYGTRTSIAAALATGVALALIPGGTILWFLIFVPMMLVRINQAALLGMMGLLRLAAPLYDPLTERLGYAVLTSDALLRPMTALLEVPGMAWLRLDDAFVFGGLTAGVLGWPVAFLIGLLLVGFYRRYLASRIKSLFRRIGARVPWLKRFGSAVSTARGLGGRA